MKIEPAHSQNDNALMRRSILVVEDEVLIRLYLAEELRAAGYIVIEAAETNEAAVLLSSRDDIGLVLTDRRLAGGAKGEDLARVVRRKYPGIKIVLLSADLPLETPVEFDETLGKPVRSDILLQLVRQLLPRVEPSG